LWWWWWIERIRFDFGSSLWSGASLRRPPWIVGVGARLWLGDQNCFGSSHELCGVAVVAAAEEDESEWMWSLMLVVILREHGTHAWLQMCFATEAVVVA
jgi:hypothetical protein